MSTQLTSFVKEVVAIIKGDNAEATGIKIQRQAKNALTPQIAVKHSFTYKLEDKIEKQKERLKLNLVNNGKLIDEDDEEYIKRLLVNQSQLEQAEEELSLHLKDIAFLESCLEDVNK